MINPVTGIVENETKWVRERAELEFDAAGKLLGGFGIVQDITDKKETEDRLRQSEARYRMLYENLRDPFVQVSMDGRIIEFNDLYCQMLGYAPEEVRALTYQELTPERWHAHEEGIVQNQIIPLGYSDVYEKEYRRKDGTIFPVELRTILSRDTSGRQTIPFSNRVTPTRDSSGSESRCARPRIDPAMSRSMKETAMDAATMTSTKQEDDRAFRRADNLPGDAEKCKCPETNDAAD